MPTCKSAAFQIAKNPTIQAANGKIPSRKHAKPQVQNAEQETFDILSQYKDKNLKILMHCFTGSKKFAEKLSKTFLKMKTNSTKKP